MSAWTGPAARSSAPSTGAELAASVASLPEEVRVGDFREVLCDLPPGSVDLIFTDPPYAPQEYPLYGGLAELAARVLVPGGSLVAYAPIYALGDLLPRLTPHLRFWSALTVRHTAGCPGSTTSG